MPRGWARHRFNIRRGCRSLYRSREKEVRLIKRLATDTGQERQRQDSEKEDEYTLTHKQQGHSNLLCCPVKNVRRSALA